MRSLIAGILAAPWIAWALVRTFGISVPYPLVAVMAFTPYAALSSPVAVAVGLLVRRWAVAGVAAAAMLAFAVALVPRALAGPDPRGPRLVVMTSNLYVDAADAAGRGLVWTWPARRRTRALPLTIDHILVDERVDVASVKVIRVPGSDHRAVIATLRLPSA